MHARIRSSAKRAAAAWVCATLIVACGAAPSARPATAKKSKAPEAPEAPAAALSELSAVEAALARELERDVTKLSVEIGERNVDKKWELASAADYIASELEDAEYQVERHGYDVGEVAAQNLIVDVPGGRRGDELVIVGAHYDSAPGSPGADDNASGTAALLALARRLRGSAPLRRLRFVFFTNEEPPHFQTPQMGSLMYAKHIAARGEVVRAMISIESIGTYSDAPGSQRYPEGLAARHPTVGNFLAVVSDEPSAQLGRLIAASLKENASLPVVSDALPGDLPGVGWSDHWSFWQIGAPAVMITDTAPFRSAHYHKPTDVPKHLDFNRMARAVAGLLITVEELAKRPGLPLRDPAASGP